MNNWIIRVLIDSSKGVQLAKAEAEARAKASADATLMARLFG
jgi:hypothetical protein